MVVDSETEAMHYRLEEWGRWSHDHEPGAMPPETIIAKLIEYGPIGAAHQDSTPVTMPPHIEAVELAVCRLPLLERDAVKFFYTKWEPEEVTAKRLTVRPKVLSDILRVARKRLMGML